MLVLALGRSFARFPAARSCCRAASVVIGGVIPVPIPNTAVKPTCADGAQFPVAMAAGITPVPIPNTAVKPASADGTWGVAPWESRTPPGFLGDCRRASSCPTASPPTSRRGSTSSGSPPWPPWRSSSSRVRHRPRRPDWWHTNPVGHFFNSLHLWSVEAVHGVHGHPPVGQVLDGRLARQRGLTWITGVVAFVASVVECFTGYLSQQNFDSQWIATSGKDAFNAVGVGAFFNLMNFGQMLMWHIVLIPSCSSRSSAPTCWLVRVRGVSHPLPVKCEPTDGRRAGRGRGRRRRVARSHPPLRHREGGDDRHRRRPGARRGPRRDAVVARRPPVTVRHLGQDRTGGLHGDRGDRAGRHERDRHLRPAVQPQPGNVAAPLARPGRSRRACASRSTPPRRSSSRPFQARPTDPALAWALADYNRAPATTRTRGTRPTSRR
jgi:hypothetical protein